jgi:hypothetical protein
VEIGSPLQPRMQSRLLTRELSSVSATSHLTTGQGAVTYRSICGVPKCLRVTVHSHIASASDDGDFGHHPNNGEFFATLQLRSYKIVVQLQVERKPLTGFEISSAPPVTFFKPVNRRSVPHTFVFRGSPTGLYWSIRGRVRCRKHLADIDEDRWRADKWAPLPPSAFERDAPHLSYQCQRCSTDGNALGPLSTRDGLWGAPF